ncbi:MFS transporter [Streptomyces rimosus]|uniref:MFS transporter n=1 Tax=Streptomyces rimosus TaxID=1927 RepID=UPI00067CEFE7|nr:MFS transporter [Streptomyces rimosus]
MTDRTAPPHGEYRPALRQWLLLVVILAGTFLVELDLFVVNVALQPMRADLAAGVTEMELVVAGYTLAFGLVLVTGGRLGDLFGCRRLFVIGVTAFSTASLACALAWAPAALIAFRVVQGTAAGLMLPQTLSLIRTEFSGRYRAMAFGVFGAVTGIATIIGQTVGGLLITLDFAGLAWRTVFLVNLPFGLAAVLGSLVLLPKDQGRKPDRSNLDLPGVVLLTATLLCVIAPLVCGGGEHGHPLLWAMLVPAAFGGWAFTCWENRTKKRKRLPLADPELLRHRAFRAGAGLSLTFVAGNTGLFFLVSLHFQGALGFSPLTAGLVFTPLALFFGIASLMAPRIRPRAGHHVLTIGYVINVLGTAVLLAVAAHYGEELPKSAVIASFAVIGFGEGLGLTPLINTVLTVVPERDAGSASGVLETGIQIGSALGPALLGTVYAATGSFVRGLGVDLVLAVLALAFLPLLSPSRDGHAPEPSTQERVPKDPQSRPKHPLATPTGDE